jgi:hypothetical protein
MQIFTTDPITGIIIVAVILTVAIGFRLYMIRTPGAMKAKCPKCKAVFDSSRNFSGIHLGPYKYLDCPACGRSSFMNSYSREAITWPQKNAEERN